MKSLPILTLVILASTIIGCKESNVEPKSLPNYVRVKTGTTYSFLKQDLDSNLLPIGATKTLNGIVLSDTLTGGGKTGIIEMDFGPGDNNYFYFDANGDYVYANDDNDELWDRLPFYSKQTYNRPPIDDSTFGSGTRRVERSSFAYDGTDTVIIGNTTFDALRVKWTRSTDTYITPSDPSYYTTVFTFWFIPKLGYFGKESAVGESRDSNQNIISHHGWIQRMISYDIKK